VEVKLNDRTPARAEDQSMKRIQLGLRDSGSCLDRIFLAGRRVPGKAVILATSDTQQWTIEGDVTDGTQPDSWSERLMAWGRTESHW